MPEKTAAPVDADDLPGLVAGDSGALRRVYDRYAGLVHYVARRHGLPREEADDILQEVFLRLYRRAGEIRDARRIKAWLVACARNLAIDRLRRQKREAPLPDDHETGGGGVWGTDGATPGHEAELALVRRLLDRIAETPGGETLRMFYADGLSVKEIAARRGEAVSTVTTRLSRLRERFRDELRAAVQALRDERVQD